MEPAHVAILTAVAFATATLTAMVGLGGGIILLAVMLLYLEPLVAIPVHAVIQLVSNSTRTYIQRRHVRWEILRRYALLLLPMGYVGIALARSIAPEHLRVAIGLFVLAATWLPARLLLQYPGGVHPPRQFLVLGGVAGFLNVIVGATGPMMGPFFRNLGLPRQGIVGTFAACQMAGHMAKLLVFGTVGFAFLPFLLPVAAMSLGVMGGTWVGSRLLERTEERSFGRVYRVVLTLVALRLILWGGLSS